MSTRWKPVALAFAGWFAIATAAAAAEEPPLLAARVKEGKLPPMAERLPKVPLVVPFDGKARVPGKYGGDMRMLMAKDRDIRMMVVYGYARLVGYNEKLEFVPDLLESFENVGDRDFTFRLRPGHRWSDGTPFTSEDFRYFWEDIANNKALLVHYDGHYYFPVAAYHAATEFGVQAIGEADYRELKKQFASQGTPTLYVNCRPIVGAQPYEVFQRTVDEELAKAAALQKSGVKVDAAFYQRICDDNVKRAGG